MEICKGTPRRSRTGDYECPTCGRCWDADTVPDSHADPKTVTIAPVDASVFTSGLNASPAEHLQQVFGGRVKVSPIADHTPPAVHVGTSKPGDLINWEPVGPGIAQLIDSEHLGDLMPPAKPVSPSLRLQQVGRIKRDALVLDIDPPSRRWYCIDGPLSGSKIQSEHRDFDYLHGFVRVRYYLHRHESRGYVWSTLG